MFDDDIELLEVVDDETGDTYFYEMEVGSNGRYVYSGIEMSPEIAWAPLELDWSSF